LGGPDQLDVEPVQHALAREIERTIERRLPAHCRQQCIRPLALDDFRDHRPDDRLDVGDVRHFRIRHDRCWVAVHQDHAKAFLAQRLAGLRSGIGELARLTDDDRAGGDDEDAFDVAAFWHCYFFSISFAKRSKRYEISCGPGLASGCPWKQNAGLSVSVKPCRLPSNNETCVTRALRGSVAGSTANPWFWLVIRTWPVSRSRTGWWAPWWPNFILRVLPPTARPSNWWPRHIPKVGTPASRNLRIAATGSSEGPREPASV